MKRINQLNPSTATGKTRRLFDSVQSKLSLVPNLFRVLGNSPAALEGYLQMSAALGTGALDARVREQIALTVAEINLCSYCLSAHTFIGGKLGLTEKDMTDARLATAARDKTDAILKLARSIVVQRGEISDVDLKSTRDAGVSDAEIVETVANVAVNIFTNYVNHVARTVVDFPEVNPGEASEAAETCATGCGCGD